MFKKLLCKLIGHKINPFSIVEYVMINQIKCSRCNTELKKDFLEKKWQKNKCSKDSIYSYKQIKEAMKTASKNNGIYDTSFKGWEKNIKI